MRFFVRRHVGHTTDRAVAAGSAKIGTIIGITIIVGVAVGAAAIGLGLGLGFGLTNNPSVSTTPLLSPPIVNCDATATARCGCQAIRPVFTPRIINGQPAATNSWPWMVYLTMNNSRVCSGFLISARHVLTAGSCLVPQVGFNITVNIGINNFQSTFGGINITNASILSAISVGDIGIVTLGTNITFNSTVQPCCLSVSSALPVTGTPGVIAGWGETSTVIGAVARTLQQAVVQVRDPSVCGVQTGNDTLCASFGSISACPIDTGGPLMVANNNAWTCVGIIDGRTPGCTNPISFTRISSYMTWIQNVTASAGITLITN